MQLHDPLDALRAAEARKRQTLDDLITARIAHAEAVAELLRRTWETRAGRASAKIDGRDDAIKAALAAGPLSRSNVCKAVGGRKTDVLARINTLISAGDIREAKTLGRRLLNLVSIGATS